MSKVVFCDRVPITIFDDNHELHTYENHLKVICSISDEIFTVSSNKGSLLICCPGCGSPMFENESMK